MQIDGSLSAKSRNMMFTKNIQFTRLVKANGRLREFNFRKSNGLKDGVFTVDVSDDRGNRIVFHMEKPENDWKFIEPQVPAWVRDIEPTLNELIEEEMLNNSNV
jgi:hypothetical protein